MGAVGNLISAGQWFGPNYGNVGNSDDGELEAAQKDNITLVSNHEIAVSWLGVLICLVAIRVLYEMAS